MGIISPVEKILWALFVFFHFLNIDELLKTGEEIMTSLKSWFSVNKMTLNAEKSTFTIFKSCRKVINLLDSIEFLGISEETTSKSSKPRSLPRGFNIPI